MRLVRVSIEGFRSIGEKIDVVIDHNVTVLLGANDHGKTNFLDALSFLNREESFSTDDLNWDRSEQGEALPALHYVLELSLEERNELARLDAAERFYAEASTARSSASEELDALSDEISTVESEIEDISSAKNEAAAAVNEAREAWNAATEDQGSKEALAEAEKTLAQTERELTHARRSKENAESRVKPLNLALALADARVIEANHLHDAESIPDAYVAGLADEAAKIASSQSKALKRASAKTANARSKLEGIADGEQEARQAAEEELKAAEGEEETIKKESGQATRRSRQLRSAAEALARLAENDSELAARDIPVASLVKHRKAPETITLQRIGLKGKLELTSSGDIEDAALKKLVDQHLPRVQIVEPTEKLPDDVSAAQLEQDLNPFMRGIFLYAGIEPSEWEWIFTQDTRSQMRLEQASQQLNKTLRESWSQGKQLTFRLAHDSKRSKITLGIKDPSVASTFTKPSQRSSGFTHFFALKTILHAWQTESTARSYVWLFDEPGIHLHPDGQRDLIQAMETLSQTNQVLYTTHSIFLANQNYPARHRLLTRRDTGTKLESKPFVSRWRSALDALGLSLAGTVLFAPHVLLVEGDSDAIYLTAMLRRVISSGPIDLDLNRFAAIPTGDASNAGALVRILSDGAPAALRPQIGVLVDGDQGGKDRLRSIKKLMEARKIPSKELTKNTTTEDHIPGAKTLYLDAVVSYLKEVGDISDETVSELRTSFEQKFGSSEATSGLAEWTRAKAREIAGFDEKPSPVGIARAYAVLLDNTEPDALAARELTRAKKLGDWISDALKVPGQTLDQDQILESLD